MCAFVLEPLGVYLAACGCFLGFVVWWIWFLVDDLCFLVGWFVLMILVC